MFLVNSIALDGEYPIIYLQEVSSNESESSLERSDAMRNLQELYTENGDLQGVPERNTERNQIGAVRPQQTSSSGQRNSVRTEGQYGTVLSSKSKESINTGATSNEEVASFVPENEQSEVFESGEENNTPETENPESEEFEEDFEEENGSFFDEPSAEFPKPNLIEDIGAKAAGVTRYSDGQRLIMRIGKNLGYKVVFDPELKTKMGATSNGKIDFDNKIIYLNPAVSKPLQFIFGHEITHFGTASETFEEFIEPIRKTNLYLKWLQRKTGSDSSSVGLLEGLYRERVMESRKNADPMGAAEAQEEMYADFCGETFFSDGERGLTRLLNSLEGKKRSKVMQFILDFVSYLKEKLSGNKDITLQLIRLESKFADLLKSAKENTAHNSGVKYDFGITQADINNYVDAAYKKENTEDYKKYAKASEKLISDVADDIDIREYNHALRDNDIRHIKNSHGENTNEKYPVTKDDIKLIPWIVENYDKVFFKTNANGKPGLVYVKVTTDNVIYYVEAVTEEYHNEKLLINKQMVKTGTQEIPNLYGLIKAINKKESSSQYLADLLKIREAYVQDVKENYSNDSILNNEPSVNTYGMPKNEKYSISLDERAENDTETVNEIDNYSEEQYNNFGWVRYNNVLTAAEYSTLLSRYADYKHNKDSYPTTRFGEAVIHSYDYPNILMYVKGTITNPHITKIIKIEHNESWAVPFIQEEILSNEHKQNIQPFSTVEDYFGDGVLRFFKARDYDSFREKSSRRKERNVSKRSNSTGEIEQKRTRGLAEGERISRADLKGSAFSIPKNEKYSISLDEKAENDTETDSDIGDIPSAMEELMHGKTGTVLCLPKLQNGESGGIINSEVIIMVVKTPSYCQEEKYQPLIEVETVHGNKVSIPKLYEENWEICAATKESMLHMWKQGKAAGYLKPTSDPRAKWAVDLTRVFLEVYEE